MNNKWYCGECRKLTKTIKPGRRYLKPICGVCFKTYIFPILVRKARNEAHQSKT